jgi:hypothetical protein
MEIERETGQRMTGGWVDGKHPFMRHKHSGLTSRSIRRMNKFDKKLLESVRVAAPMKLKPRGFSN